MRRRRQSRCVDKHNCALHVYRRICTEKTPRAQTIAAKFEQVGAELELSYDDAGAKPEARRQELARLRKQHADNQDYVLEMEEELAELRTQNDQLRRKAASIERELVRILLVRVIVCVSREHCCCCLHDPLYLAGGEWPPPDDDSNAATASLQDLNTV